MSDLSRVAAVLTIAVLAAQAMVAGQARGRAPAQSALRTEAPMMTCPNVLGEGVQTKRSFCDVLIGRDPAQGVIIQLPLHTGPVTLTFDLHNRHTYSEELAKTSRGYRRYTASIGVLALDNTLISRAVVQSEVRTAKDLFDRVAGLGAGGVKAVAPTGAEPIVISIPAVETSVSILGESLTEERVDLAVDTFRAPGRPAAVISNVMIEYRPGPAPRTPARRR